MQWRALPANVAACLQLGYIRKPLSDHQNLMCAAQAAAFQVRIRLTESFHHIERLDACGPLDSCYFPVAVMGLTRALLDVQGHHRMLLQVTALNVQLPRCS